MTIPIKTFSHDQSNAPQCSGEPGKLDAILYSALVTGFNPKSITGIAVSNNIATATTSTTHGYAVYDILKIEGANESVFNDEFQILSTPTSTTFTFAITTALTAATGTTTCKIAPLGWTREFTGTNLAVYRPSDVFGTRLYLKVDDTPAKTAKLNMYETMNGLDSGTGKSTDIFWCKSNLASSATRKWYLVGDSKRFYLMIDWRPDYPNQVANYSFGDIASFKATDAWRCALIGHNATDPGFPSSNTSALGTNGLLLGMIMARGPSGLGGNVSIGFYSITRWASMGQFNTTDYVFPSMLDNKAHLSEVYIYEPTSKCYRGKHAGFFVPLEATNGAYLNKERIVFGGKTYMAFQAYSGAQQTPGNFFIDITGPWE